MTEGSKSEVEIGWKVELRIKIVKFKGRSLTQFMRPRSPAGKKSVPDNDLVCCVAGLMTSVLPDYVLPYTIHLLAHDPDFKSYDHVESLKNLKE